MQKALALLCVVTFLFLGCKKEDLNHRWKCDYVKATLAEFSEYVPQPTFPYLFAKRYDWMNRLQSIDVSYRNIADWFPSGATTLRAVYKGNSIIFLDPTNDTTAILNFNNNNKLTTAEFPGPFLGNWESKRLYRFFYTGGKLTLVEMREYNPPPGVTSYLDVIRLNYDSHKNVKKITYKSSSLANQTSTIDYEYDITRKANGQTYPDEAFGDFFQFWQFLKFLNIFEELQPKHILTRSYLTDPGYPGNYERIYTQHLLDGKKNVIKYRSTIRINDGSPAIENWTIDWRCQ